MFSKMHNQNPPSTIGEIALHQEITIKLERSRRIKVKLYMKYIARDMKHRGIAAVVKRDLVKIVSYFLSKYYFCHTY